MRKEYFQFVAAVHLFFIRDNKILLLRRFNTGYEDGNYSVPAGHIDGNERAIQAMIREAMEETGIAIDEEQLQIVHVMHRKSTEERFDFFFEINQWQGEPEIIETNKCDKLEWFSVDDLPKNMVPYVRAGIENYKNNILFSEFGWDR